MFKFINKEHPELFQWDANIQIQLEESDIQNMQVHFTNDGKNCYSVDVPQNRIVTIPNSLLQQAKPLTIYYYIKELNSDTKYTLTRYQVNVYPRVKPENYVADTELHEWNEKITAPVQAPALGTFLKVTSVNEDGTYTCEWVQELGAQGPKGDTGADGKDYIITEADYSAIASIVEQRIYNNMNT